MSKRLLIYGATGYTGRLLVIEALQLRLDPVLCGRDAAKLQACAAPLGLETRCVALNDEEGLSAMLQDAHVLLNAAGPFSSTAERLANACVRAGVHYLDVSGEVLAIDRISALHNAARARGVMLMAGVGFDVVPSDCLARHVLSRVSRPRSLAIGIAGQRLITRGSAQTMIDQLADPVLVRRGGQLQTIPPASLAHTFDYGRGPSRSIAVSWGDVATAYYSTGIGDITTFFEGTPAVYVHNQMLRWFGWAARVTPWQALLEASLAFVPEGPSEAVRLRSQTRIVAEIVDAGGRVARSRLSAPEAYTFTARTGSAIARRVMEGAWEAGFETPARVYGADFVLSFEGVEREDLT